MGRLHSRILKRISAVLVVALLVILALFNVSGVKFVNAATTESGSAVLDDLHIDESFDENNYPGISDDYSLNVIQIAETIDNKLLIYVYQPSGQEKSLTASSINISRTINDAISYYNFQLTLLNSDGVFFKYLVENMTVFSENTRYYAISVIYRPFDETIDRQAGNDNVVTEVNYAVNKQYCFGKINGNDYCSVVDIETIEITDKFVGLVRYSDGHDWWGTQWPYTDSHFVAFNTDKPIDKLLEADVYYTYQSYLYDLQTTSSVPVYGDKLDGYAHLKYDQKVEHTGEQFRAGTYTWKRIETVEEFIAENDLTQNVYSGAILDINVANKITEEGKQALEGKQWLLRFTETEYEFETHGNAASGNYWTHTASTIVGDVTILRLKFETDGLTYNLGVIDNKQSGSGKPVNSENVSVDFDPLIDFLHTALMIFALIMFLIVVGIFITPIGKALKFIFKAVAFVIALPFKFLRKLFK